MPVQTASSYRVGPQADGEELERVVLVPPQEPALAGVPSARQEGRQREEVGRFSLTLKSMFGEVLTVDVHRDTTLQELKEAFCAQKNEPNVDTLRLLHDREPLEDEEATVEELGLSEETVVMF